MKLAVLGAGSWGTALAILWSNQGHAVHLWVRDRDRAARYAEEGRNLNYLTDIPFPESLVVSGDLEETIADAQTIFLAVPLQAYREFLVHIREKLAPGQNIVILSKGIELETNHLPTEIVLDVLGEPWRHHTFTLSGPSFALEVAQYKPTAVVLAGQNEDRLRDLQAELNCQSFRMYRNTDVRGVELSAALKNVIAIASGMCYGLDLGHNPIAGVITRGLAEIGRLGVKMGAQRETFAGLAGMGDLILTCTGSLSRNLKVGMALARGKSLQDTLTDLGMVAEGVHTSRAAYHLSREQGVELPISDMVYRILYEGLPPMTALQGLMARSLKAET